MPTWIILAVTAALSAGAAAWATHAIDLGTINGLKAEAAQIRADGAKLLAESEANARAIEAAHAARALQVEKNHAEKLAKLDALDAANRRLVARVGLFDRDGSCGGNGVRRPADPPGGDPGGAAATGCRLSTDVAERIFSIAALANKTAAYAESCHAWAVGFR